MRKTVFAFPDGINEFLVADTLFARAYQETPDQKRGLLKTCIVRLYEWYGPGRLASGQTASSWRSGFDSVLRFAPVDYCVVLLDGSLRSPSRLLAGVVPPLACGVEQVLVARMGADTAWEQPLLTGLELAGQELVADMDAGRVKTLLAELAESGADGAVVDLTADGRLRPETGGPAWFRPMQLCCADVWMDGEKPFDLDALAFCQPDLDITVHGGAGELPPGNFLPGTNDLEHVLANLTEVAYLPFDLVGKGLDRASLVLGPGQEGGWIWPELLPEFFQKHRIALTTGA